MGGASGTARPATRSQQKHYHGKLQRLCDSAAQLQVHALGSRPTLLLLLLVVCGMLEAQCLYACNGR
jgi:hypothetical protein